jgi:hypothetical protein
MIRWTRRSLAATAFVAAAAALSCGEVPTLENGIAYYTTVLLPLPAVALGDSLRDSLGVATPLTVRAFTRDSQEITGLTVTFVPTVLPTLVDIDSANGMLVAHDTAVGSVQLVGRIGERLQTSIVTLLVVPQPTGIARADSPAGDTALAVPALKALPVTVSGIFKNAPTTVNGIIVRYRIDSLAPSTVLPGSAVLTNSNGTSLRPDSTIAVDTTKTAGSATRNVLVRAGSGVQRVYISASANRLKDAKPLAGSPVRFVVDLKP